MYYCIQPNSSFITGSQHRESGEPAALDRRQPLSMSCSACHPGAASTRRAFPPQACIPTPQLGRRIHAHRRCRFLIPSPSAFALSMRCMSGGDTPFAACMAWLPAPLASSPSFPRIVSMLSGMVPGLVCTRACFPTCVTPALFSGAACLSPDAFAQRHCVKLTRA